MLGIERRFWVTHKSKYAVGLWYRGLMSGHTAKKENLRKVTAFRKRDLEIGRSDQNA